MNLVSSPYSAHYFLWKFCTSYWIQLHTNPLKVQTQSNRIQTETNLEESPIHYFWRDWKLHSLTTPATNPKVINLLCMTFRCNSFANCTLNKSSLSFISCNHFSLLQHFTWYALPSGVMIFSKFKTLPHFMQIKLILTPYNIWHNENLPNKTSPFFYLHIANNNNIVYLRHAKYFVSFQFSKTNFA